MQACLSVRKLKIIGCKKKFAPLWWNFTILGLFWCLNHAETFKKIQLLTAMKILCCLHCLFSHICNCNNNEGSIGGCHEQSPELLPKFPLKVSLRSPLKSPHESARTLAAKRCRYMIICWYIYCKKLKIWRWVKSQNLLCFIPGQKRLWSKSCKGKGIFKINFATSLTFKNPNSDENWPHGRQSSFNGNAMHYLQCVSFGAVENILCLITGQKLLWSKSCRNKGSFEIEFATL